MNEKIFGAVVPKRSIGKIEKLVKKKKILILDHYQSIKDVKNIKLDSFHKMKVFFVASVV